MSAIKKRVSRAGRGVGGGNDSHNETNPPPNAAGQERSRKLRRHRRAPIAAMAPVQETRISAVLSDDERKAFWTLVLAYWDRARCMARRFVGRQNEDDVVDSVMVRCIEALPRSKKRKHLLANHDLFRRWFLKAVRNHAISCAYSEVNEPSVHANWGLVMEPVVAGKTSGDRELDHVFARNDDGEYDAPAPVQQRPQDDVEKLSDIFREHVNTMPPMQREVMYQTLFEERTRPEVAKRLAISERTYDAHRQAALQFLRVSLPQDSLAYPELDRSVWYDIFEELRERCDARSRRPSSGKKGKRARSEGEPSRSEGERHRFEGEPSPSEEAPHRSEGDRDRSGGAPVSSTVSPANS